MALPRRRFLKRTLLASASLPFLDPARSFTQTTAGSESSPVQKEPGASQFWPQWRGPTLNGVAPLADPPVEWGEKKNIRWKIPLPGKGHSTPVIWGDLVFLTVAEPFGNSQAPVYDHAPGTHDNVGVTNHHRFLIMAVSRHDGTIIWKKVLREEFPHEGGHQTGSLASNSPVTDGELLFAFFGSRGLYCLDMKGNVKWQKDLGRMQTLHAHGEGASPAIYGDMLIVNWDHEGASFLYAFDKFTGKEIWKVPRDEKTSWSTPLVVTGQGVKPQVVVSATKRVRSYDLGSGALLWECAGLSRNVVSSPVAGHGLVFAANSYDWQAMLAIRLEGAKGDITGTKQVTWKLNRLTPYVPSPLLYGDTLYFLRHNQNILSAVDPMTGRDRIDPFRLANLRDIFSSPVGAASRIYITSREGATIVIRHGGNSTPLAVNQLDDVFSASPALAGRELYLRGERFLYCMAEA